MAPDQVENLGAVNSYGTQNNHFYGKSDPAVIPNMPAAEGYVERPKIERELEDHLPGAPTQDRRVVVLSGEMGAGKTIAARAYGTRQAACYPGGRFVIDASRSALDALSGFLPEIAGETSDERAYKFAGHLASPAKRSLLILDNADDEEDFERWLTVNALPPEGFDLLITTRGAFLPAADRRYERVEVEGMTLTEALAVLAPSNPGLTLSSPGLKDLVEELRGNAALLAVAALGIARRGGDLAWYLADFRSAAPVDHKPGVADGYKIATAWVLDDYLRSLTPYARRALDYASVLPAAGFWPVHLEALMEKDPVSPPSNEFGGPLPFAEGLAGIRGSRGVLKEEGDEWVLHRLYGHHIRSQMSEADLRQVAAAVYGRAEVCFREGQAFNETSSFVAAARAFGAAIGLMQGIREVVESRGEWSPALRNDLASAYMNCGVARQSGGDLASAVADYGEAIGLMQRIRDVLEPRGEWSPALRNDLASAYMNRGIARKNAGDLASAVADYGEAIGLMQGIRDVLEPRGEWSPALRNDLAMAYMNRGNSRQLGGDLAGAVADYGEAIGLRQGIRDVLEPRGEWSPALRNDLASAFLNRGVARYSGGDLASAVADYGEAIGLMQGIRDALEPRGEWSPELRNDLARAYGNRGNARRSGGDLASAVADYGEAIGLRQGIRDALEPRGEWSPELRNDLASAYMNRGVARRSGGDLASAVADYGEAIGLMLGIRDVLEPRGEWSPALRNDLASAYVNRGNARQRGGDLASAVADYGEAIGLMLGIRDVLEPRGEWSPALRNDLAKAYGNRGNARQRGGDLVAAGSDYGEAIGLMQGIRDVLEPRGEWSPALRNDLAGAYQNRGNARQDGGDLAAAEADYGKAISLMQGIRDVLEPRGEWSPALRNDLASAYMNRGTGRQRGGDLASAVADYGEAIGLRIEVAAAYPQVVGIELQKTLAARSRISHFPAEWARLAAENIGRLRNTFPAEYLAANNVPIFNAALSAALDKVEPPLSPTELTRIRQALLD